MSQYLYLLVDLGCILVPFLFSFHKKIEFYKEWKYFLPANLIIATLFIIWDAWFTQMGVWGFNKDYLCGLFLFNLPIEEILFFFCIPYACVFTYYTLNRYLPSQNKTHLASFILLAICTVSAIAFHDKKYTFYTALLLGVLLLFLLVKMRNINTILISYLSIIPFFLLSNGILTGSFIEEPIVWYNNAENLGIRIFTIPVEDIFYGLLLILSITLLYEWFKKRFANP